MDNTKIKFRFDDVCIHSNMELHKQITDYLFEKFPGCQIIWAISPIVCYGEGKRQRVFPKEWNAQSDNRIHYTLDRMGLPTIHPKVIRASHGLIHSDHRLLTKEVQELSIIMSCRLTDSFRFVPPFNKWNKDTEEICNEQHIELVKWENGWLSMEHNCFSPATNLWYLHAREWTLDSLKKWFGE